MMKCLKLGIALIFLSSIVVSGQNTPTSNFHMWMPTFSPLSNVTVVEESITNIQITFAGVGMINSVDIVTLQSEMEQWFDAYYNEAQGFGQGQMMGCQGQQYHCHEQQFRVPEVRNMITVINIMNQDTSSSKGSNVVLYTQNLVYEATADAKPSEDYAILPFVDTQYKIMLLANLKANVISFVDLSDISTPLIQTLSPIPSPVSTVAPTPLSPPAIPTPTPTSAPISTMPPPVSTVSPTPLSPPPIPRQAPTSVPISTSVTASPVIKYTPNVTVVKERISNLQITFTGVGTINSVDIITLQSGMEKWFEAYFNEVQENQQRRILLRGQQYHRRVQQFRVPDVQNMTTVIDITSQDTTSTHGTNTVQYTQTLLYEATKDARPADDYALMPCVDTPYKNTLLASLKANVTSFVDVVAISTPLILEPSATLSPASNVATTSARTSNAPSIVRNIVTTLIVYVSLALWWFM
jgi:hypothetical protein